MSEVAEEIKRVEAEAIIRGDVHSFLYEIARFSTVLGPHYRFPLP
jgi:hypothetical protein